MPDPRKPRNTRPQTDQSRRRDSERDHSRGDQRKKPRSPRDRGRARVRKRDISDVRQLNAGEREIVFQVGRFRAIAIKDFKQHLPKSVCDSPVHTVRALKELGLVRSNYIKPHGIREVRKRDAELTATGHNKPGTRSPKIEIITLTNKGATWLRANGYDETHAGKLRPGMAKPREVFHDAHLYSMAQKEIVLLQKQGAINISALTDNALKELLYKERSRLIKEGRSKEEAHIEAAQIFDVPLTEGKYSLPDVRVEYDMPDGTHHKIDLELITDTYRQSHIAAKNAAGFTSYTLNKAGSMARSTSDSKGGTTPWDEDWMARSIGR